MAGTEVENPLPWVYWTRGTWLAVWASLAAVVLAAGVLVVSAWVNSMDDEYGPITGGSLHGRGSPGIRFHKNAFGDARLVTTGSRTTPVYESMYNEGSHSVVVTGIDLDDVTVRAQWAPYPQDDEATVPDPKAHWRNFPATIEAGTEVLLRYSIRRPTHCQDEPMSSEVGEYYDDSHVVHWESLLSEHTTSLDGGLNQTTDSGIQIC